MSSGLKGRFCQPRPQAALRRRRRGLRMDLDFDPVGVVLTAQAGGGASPPEAWVSDKKHSRPVGAVHG